MKFHVLSFSVQEYIGSKRPSELSPYFRLVNKTDVTIKYPVSYGSSYLIKGNKYFVFITDDNKVVTYLSNLRPKNVFQLETVKVTSLHRHNLSLLFSTQNNVGFLKIFEEVSDQIFCEVGTAKIQRVYGDQLTPNIIYALTEEQDGNDTVSHIVIFEIKQSQSRVGIEECKINGKIKLSGANHDKYSLETLRGFIVTMDQSGTAEVHKALTINDLLHDQISYSYQPFKSIENTTSESSEVTDNIRVTRSHQGT
jgi:hypothetical protein